ncbi:MAG: hypothetical protein H6708_22385 [Kofleriaceae bacterium]|nr:hypothetical protein [Myxococcales bacterium]MCB9563155.1 hypothetical protein [Kofleriaceae bacterium]
MTRHRTSVSTSLAAAIVGLHGGTVACDRTAPECGPGDLEILLDYTQPEACSSLGGEPASVVLTVDFGATQLTHYDARIRSRERYVFEVPAAAVPGETVSVTFYADSDDTPSHAAGHSSFTLSAGSCQSVTVEVACVFIPVPDAGT